MSKPKTTLGKLSRGLMKSQGTAKVISLLLASNLWLIQQAWAQNQQSQPSASPGQSQAQPPLKPKTSGTTINPSQGPLQPATTYPDATTQQEAKPSTSAAGQTTSTTPNAPQPKNQPAEPQGAAAAERVKTAGGAAAKPAGVAIAPAKQHRTRSLLIKVGAIAAAGAAAGTVYALSRGTSPTPPGSTGPGVVPK